MAAASSGLNRFYMLLGATAVAAAAALAFVTLRKPDVSIPANVVVTAADTNGFSGYYLGSDSAPITVTEYADYECPACQQWFTIQFPTIEERLIKTGQVRWRYRDFPLDMHRNSRPAAHAAACADEQGKYWEMSHRIYSWEPNWTLKADGNGIFRDHAKALGLDMARYDSCMETAKFAGRIQAGRNEGGQVGVGSTPTFLINGRLYPGGGAVHYDMLKAMLDSLGRAASR
ncbi:MAG: thioredoxin domain-containing protein [Gemmatimonadales bacterium]